MDALDKKILTLVQVDASLTAEQIGGHVGLSASSVQRRLHRLKEEGVIRGNVAVVAHEAVGRPFLLIVELKVENDREPEATQFVQRLVNAPEVMQCYYVTGRADYVLIVTMKDMNEYEVFTQRLFIEAPNVVSFETSVVIKPLKMTLSVPVE